MKSHSNHRRCYISCKGDRLCCCSCITAGIAHCPCPGDRYAATGACTSAPSVNVAVRPVEQLSVTLAVPKAALIWLQSDYIWIGEWSNSNHRRFYISCKGDRLCCVPVLPQASLTVHVLVIDTLQPVPGTSAPSVNVAVRPVEQLSVTLAVPKAALICAASDYMLDW